MPSPALLCDIGNVIVTFDFGLAATRLAALSDYGPETVLDRLHHLKLPLEDGRMDDDEFVTLAMNEIGYRGSASDFAEAWCDIFAANDAMTASLRRASKALPLHLLSNTSNLHKEHLFATYPAFALFQDGVYSYAVRSSKPETRIYEIAIEQLDLDPRQTFYIDDLAANIETARTMGFTTHLYAADHHAEFDEALDRWLTCLPQPA